jgi:hypothetical protein
VRLLTAQWPLQTYQVVLAVNSHTKLKLADDMLCHVTADLSGLVFFSTDDLSTSCIQFDLVSFADCRSSDGQLNLGYFDMTTKSNGPLSELRNQLLEHYFIIETE